MYVKNGSAFLLGAGACGQEGDVGDGGDGDGDGDGDD